MNIFNVFSIRKFISLTSSIGLAIAAMLFLLSLSSAVSAQDDDDDEGAEVEEVLVTGSRIPQKSNLIAPSPITQVNADEFLYTGVTEVEDLLNDLPITQGDNDNTANNGAVGISSVDLRALGRDRTLTLLNGRRITRGSSKQAGGGADLNTIPHFLIKRVELLTGGASATYGSDALAGVVNFILDEEFKGFKVDIQRSFYNHENTDILHPQLNARNFAIPESTVNDGYTSALSLAFGVKTDKGHMALYGMYRDVDPIYHADRDHSACALSSNNSSCGGSSTIPQTRITDFGSLEAAIRFPGTITRVAQIANYDSAVHGASSTLNATYVTSANLSVLNEPGAVAAGTPVVAGFDWYVPAPAAGASSNNQFDRRAGTVLFNFAPRNIFQRPGKRSILGGYGHYDFNDHVTGYAEVNYMNLRSLSQIAPSGNFFETDNLFCGNPLLSEQQFQTICGRYGLTKNDFFQSLQGREVTALFVERTSSPTMNPRPNITTQVTVTGRPTINIGRRNLEGGERQEDLSYASLRAVFGVRGDFGTAWSYDAFANFSRTDLTNIYLNDISITRINRSLDVINTTRVATATDGSTSVQTFIACRSATSVAGAPPVDANCVPWNVFTNNGNRLAATSTGGVTQAAIDYLILPLYEKGETTLSQITAHIVGDLGEYGIALPWADTGISFSVGYERVAQSLEHLPDSNYISGDGSGQGGPTVPVSGSLFSDEMFFEAHIPIIENASFADALNLDIGYRTGSYSTDQDVNSSKLALSWVIRENYKVRASVQQAIRHAHARELFAPQGIQLINATDPCAGSNPGRTEAECMKTGLMPGQYGLVAASPAGQYNRLNGGNPNLRPETSDTFSYGFVLTPLDGLSVSLDYYDINIEETIGRVGFSSIISQCIENDRFCNLIQRGSGGTLWLGNDQVVDTNQNVGTFSTSGFDLNFEYLFGIGSAGKMRASLVANFLQSYETMFLGDLTECVGAFSTSCGVPNPEMAYNARLTWLSPYSLVMSLALRHIAAVDLIPAASNQIDHLAAANYIDLTAIYSLYDKYEFRVGFNNLLDENPPYRGNPPTNASNGNTYSQIYDARGRYVFFGFRLNM